MQTSWKRRLLVVPPIVLGIALLVVVAKGRKPPVQGEEAEQVRVVRTLTVQPGAIVPSITGYGVVEPARVWNAVAQVAGRVDFVHPDLKKGAILKAGTEIVRIAPDDYAIAVRQAEANIAAAEAKLAELAVSEKNTRASVALERQSLDINEKELQRKESLEARGAVSAASLDQERRNLLTQRKRVLDLENALRLLPTQIRVQQEQKTISETELQQARLNLARTSLKLPFDARISAANVEITQFAAMGTLLAAADSIDRAEVAAQITQTHLRDLLAASRGESAPPIEVGEGAMAKLVQKLGMKAQVRVRLGDKQIVWPAEVVRISDTVDPKTRTVGVVVSVGETYRNAVVGERPPLVKGMFVEVEIRTGRLDNRLLVPRAALHGERLYLADKDDRLTIRDVKRGFVQGDFVIIDKGLTAGERVILGDPGPVLAGLKLKTSEDETIASRLARLTSEGGEAR